MKTLHTHDRHAPVDRNLPEALRANEVLHTKPLSSSTYQGLMDVKKERQQSYEEKRPLFMMIGLTISLFLVVLGINWKFYDKTELVDLGQVENDFEEVLEVPPSLQPPPPPPKKLEVFTLKEVDDNKVIEELQIQIDVETTEDMEVEQVIYEPVFEEVEEEVEEIFTIVEEQPSFPGGISKFYEYVANSIEYPSSARRLNITGRVFVKFVIEKDGTVTDVQVIKGIGAGCDEEARRVIEATPNWNPGKQRGRNVRVYMTVPIMFKLQEN